MMNNIILNELIETITIDSTCSIAGSKKLSTNSSLLMKILQLGIESHFVGVYGPYELHRKEKQIKCTALAVHENLLFFPMQFIWPVNTDKMRFNTYIYIF